MRKPLGTILFLLLWSLPLWAQTAADTSAAAHKLPETSQPLNMGWMLFKTAAVLALIIVLIFVSVYLLKKYVYRGFTSADNSDWIKVLSQFQIQPKKFIALVQVFDRLLVVGITDASIRTLSEISDPQTIQAYLEQMTKAPENWRGNKFLDMLKKNFQTK